MKHKMAQKRRSEKSKTEATSRQRKMQKQKAPKWLIQEEELVKKSLRLDHSAPKYHNLKGCHYKGGANYLQRTLLRAS